MNSSGLREFIEDVWQSSIVERLQAYIRIPNKSPAFDPEWQSHGYMDQAIELMAAWCRVQPVAGMRVEVRRLEGLTPILLVDIPGELPGCVLLYGHLDKQPEFTGWLPGLGPWEPVIRDGKLYGRGGADDGYAVFSSLTAIAALKAQAIALPRCVILIEATEESGSVHLPAHLDALGKDLGEPSLVVCLDAECGNYQQLWTTTSLRGNLVGRLKVRVLSEGAHSGLASGIAPTAFRLIQQLLERVENPLSGELLLAELHADIPKDRRAQIGVAAEVLGAHILDKVPFVPGAQPVTAGSSGTAHQQYLAAVTCGDRRGWPAAAAHRGQCAAAGNHFEGFPASAAHGRSGQGQPRSARGLRARSALRRASELRARVFLRRLECPGIRALVR